MVLSLDVSPHNVWMAVGFTLFVTDVEVDTTPMVYRTEQYVYMHVLGQ